MKELRKKLRIIRKSIDTPTRKKQGKKLLYQCQKHAIFRNAKHIAIFTPNDGEIETIDTINFLKNQGYYVYLPILVGEKLKFAKMGKLFRKNRADGEIHGEFSNPKMKTIDGRIGVWTSDEGVVGRPYVSILDTIQRGLGDRILFFPYEQWSSNPDFWFKKLYEFIGEEYYQHDFSNIEQTIRENDAGYGWGNDLHEIKKGGLLPAKSDAIDIIGREWYKKLHDTEFWKRK